MSKRVTEEIDVRALLPLYVKANPAEGEFQAFEGFRPATAKEIGAVRQAIEASKLHVRVGSITIDAQLPDDGTPATLAEGPYGKFLIGQDARVTIDDQDYGERTGLTLKSVDLHIERTQAIRVTIEGTPRAAAARSRWPMLDAAQIDALDALDALAERESTPATAAMTHHDAPWIELHALPGRALLIGDLGQRGRADHPRSLTYDEVRIVVNEGAVVRWRNGPLASLADVHRAFFGDGEPERLAAPKVDEEDS